MRAVPGLASLVIATVLAAHTAPLMAVPPEPAGRLQAGHATCPHLGQLVALAQGSGHRLAARRIGGDDIARLFGHLSVDLPPRLARADTAVVVHERLGGGRAVIVLFAGGCVLAALRLPAADAVRALARIDGQEI